MNHKAIYYAALSGACAAIAIDTYLHSTSPAFIFFTLATGYFVRRFLDVRRGGR